MSEEEFASQVPHSSFLRFCAYHLMVWVMSAALVWGECMPCSSAFFTICAFWVVVFVILPLIWLIMSAKWKWKFLEYGIGATSALACPFMWYTLVTPRILAKDFPDNVYSGNFNCLPDLFITHWREVCIVFLPLTVHVLQSTDLLTTRGQLLRSIYSVVQICDVIVIRAQRWLEPPLQNTTRISVVIATVAVLLLNSIPVMFAASAIATKRAMNNFTSTTSVQDMSKSLATTDETDLLRGVDLEKSSARTECEGYDAMTCDGTYAYIFSTTSWFIDAAFATLRVINLIDIGSLSILDYIFLAKNLVILVLTPSILLFVRFKHVCYKQSSSPGVEIFSLNMSTLLPKNDSHLGRNTLLRTPVLPKTSPLQVESRSETTSPQNSSSLQGVVAASLSMFAFRLHKRLSFSAPEMNDVFSYSWSICKTIVVLMMVAVGWGTFLMFSCKSVDLFEQSQP